MERSITLSAKYWNDTKGPETLGIPDWKLENAQMYMSTSKGTWQAVYNPINTHSLTPCDEHGNPLVLQQGVDWGFACGRHYLSVAGIVVAVEGDPCRDSTLGGGNWDKEKILIVCNKSEANHDLIAEREAAVAAMLDKGEQLGFWINNVIDEKNVCQEYKDAVCEFLDAMENATAGRELLEQLRAKGKTLDELREHVKELIVLLDIPSANYKSPPC